MPSRRKSNLGRRTRQTERSRRRRSNKTEEERASNRLNTFQTRNVDPAERRAARLEDARLRARQSRSAATNLVRSERNEREKARLAETRTERTAENSLRKKQLRCYEGQYFVAKRNHRSIQESTSNASEYVERLLDGCFEQKHENFCVGSIESIHEKKNEQKYPQGKELLHTVKEEIIEERNPINMSIKKEVEFGSDENQITDTCVFNEDIICGNFNDSVHQCIDTTISCNKACLELVKKELDETIVKHDVFIKDEPSVEFHSSKNEIKPIANQILEENIFPREVFSDNGNKYMPQRVVTDNQLYTGSIELVKEEFNETVESIINDGHAAMEFHSSKDNHESMNISFKEGYSENCKQFSEDLAVEMNHESAKCIKTKKHLNISLMMKIDENGFKDCVKQYVHQINAQLSDKQKVEEQERAGFPLNNNNKLKCEIDDLQTSSVESVLSEKKPFKCFLCDYEAISISDYTYHAKEVHFSFKCRLCPFRSYTKTHFVKHYNSVHSKLRTYKCQYCDYAAKLKHTLKKHIAAVHLQELKYSCDFCDYAPKRRVDLKRHIQVVHLKFKSFHQNEVRYKCDLCDYGSGRRDAVKRHVDAVHLKVKNFKCNLCKSRSFSSNYKLKAHISTVHSIKKNV